MRIASRSALALVFMPALCACGTSANWSLDVHSSADATPASTPMTSNTTEGIPKTEGATALAPLAPEHELALRERLSRHNLTKVLKAVGIDAWEHPEIARALGMDEQPLPVADMLLRREEILRSIPQTMPADGYISSLFGARSIPGHTRMSLHKGLDIAAMQGTTIYAPADGVVRYAASYGGFGNYISIVHGYGIVTKYAHNDKLLVKKGARVKRGDPIATVGGSGRSRGVHLHYEIWLNDKPVDPLAFLPQGLSPSPAENSLLASDQ